MIKFITEDQDSGVVLSDVKNGQFFVDCQGWLCQKRNARSYNTIADQTGRPVATPVTDSPANRPIKRGLPAVTRVVFD